MLTSDGKKLIIISAVLTSLATIFFALRIARNRKILGLDDWLLGFSVLHLWLQHVGAHLSATKGGEGKNISDLKPSELVWLLKMVYWTELSYTICIATIKISVLLSYNRIFGRFKWFRYSLITVGILTCGWFIGVFFPVLFQCTPVDKAWDTLKPGHCIALKPFLWGNSISNTVLDYSILFLPMLPVLKLKMSRIQKLLVLASFSLGSLASISSTMRAVKTNTIDMSNFSATLFKDSIWTHVELNAGVISACLPYLANIFGQNLAKAFKSLSNLAYNTTSLLRLRGHTNNNTDNTSVSQIGTHRATYEAYETKDSNHQGLPTFKDRDMSEESVRNLV